MRALAVLVAVAVAGCAASSSTAASRRDAGRRRAVHRGALAKGIRRPRRGFARSPQQRAPMPGRLRSRCAARSVRARRAAAIGLAGTAATGSCPLGCPTSRRLRSRPSG